MADERTEVRCDQNPFSTLLFRHDERGVWVYCRDCREAGKRGQEHLITWRRIFRMFLGLDDDKHGQRANGDNSDSES